jgi:hypothetical protein
MKKRYISRRNFISRTAGLVLTLWAGKGLAQAKLSGKLEINFELAMPSGGRYRAPYVAVWVENAQGKPVREIALWLNRSGQGQRWLKELRRWYHNDDMDPTVTASTRMSGNYTLSWNCKDDWGNLMPQGDYYVCVEMAREHGPYELFREKVALGPTDLRKTYPMDGELKEVTLTYSK